MKLPPIRLLLTGIFVTFGGGFHFGYQLAAINPTEAVLKRFFNESFTVHYGESLTFSEMTYLWSGNTGIMIVGAFFGALIMPCIAEKLGRRRGLFISSFLFIFATFPSALSYTFNSFELFILGRVLYGIGIGMASGFQGLYLSEISPTQYRGFISAFTGLMMQMGLTCAAVLGVPAIWGTESDWSKIFWVEILPTIILIVVLALSHDSPTFLISHGQESKAKISLLVYHEGHAHEMEKIVEAIRAELALQKESLGISQLLGVRLARKGTLLGVVANIGISFSGAGAISFFATQMLTMTGFSHENAAYANVAICASTLIGSGFSTWSIERFGRRPLMLLSCGCLAVLNTMLMVLIMLYNHYEIKEIPYIYLTLNIVFMLVFGIGLAPIPWFITTEMVPQNSKAAAQGLAVMAQYFTGFITPVAFFLLNSFVGPLSFLLFAIPMALSTIYFYFCLPETKNRHTREVLMDLYKDQRKAIRQADQRTFSLSEEVLTDV